MPPHGIMFHHFHDAVHPRGQGAISAQDLVDVISFIGRGNILPAAEWARRALAGSLRENDLCLTFDDGLRCQFDVAFSVLQDLDITAFWFVYSSVFEGGVEPLEIYRHFRTTAFDSIDEFYILFFRSVSDVYPADFQSALDQFDARSYLAASPFYSANDRLFRYFRDEILGSVRFNSVMQVVMNAKAFDPAEVAGSLWMDDGHLRVLAQGGHLIGLHSYTHPTRLSILTPKQQFDEYQRNRLHLTRILGEPPISMSHPCNSYNTETIEILARLGVRLGFRATLEKISECTPFEFARQDHANVMAELRQ